MTIALERSKEESTSPPGLVLPRRIGRGSKRPPPSPGDSPDVATRIATPTTIRRRGNKKTEEIKYGPKQIPIEEQAGVHLDRSVMDEFAKDSLGRDVFTIEERIQEWEETEELYDKYKDAPIPIDPKVLRISEYGIHLNGGDMGEGKTLTATWIARHFRRRGWNVFSTAGFLFGQRLRLAEAYAFPDHVTPGGFIFADEVHTLVDRYSSNSVRSRTFGQSSTAMRKERVTCIGASAHTIMVGWEYKGVSESVMVPRRWYPGGKLHAPPFCHIEVVRLFPFPYRRKDQLLMDAGLVRGIDQKRGSWRPAPQELMAAAKLMDSFESVKIGENFGIGSKEMKEEREGRGGAGAAAEGQSGGTPNLVWVVRRVWEAGYIKEGSKVFFTTLRDIIGQAGLDISATKIRSSLEMAGCNVSGSAVNEEDLRTMFEGLDSEHA